MAEIEMEIDSIRVSQMNYQRVVILKEKDSERYLPIWVGPAEADCIAVVLQNILVPRPLTHDLVCSVADVGGFKIERAVVNKLENDTFYAKLVMTSRAKSHGIDCRPSDALAVAVRVGVPIFADKKVLEEAGIYLDEEGNPIGPTSKELTPEELAPEAIKAIKDKAEKKSSQLEMFSKSSQDVLDLAEEEAKRLNHNFVGTGHLLLALVKKIPTMVSVVLGNLGLNLTHFPLEIEASIDKQSSTESTKGGLSSAVKKTIGLSVAEAKRLGSKRVQPEHILLALIHQDEGVAASILKKLEINTERVYIELIRLYSQSAYGEKP